MEAQSRTGGFLIVVVGAFLTLASFPSAGATEPFGASVTSTVVPDAYQNVVRVAPPDAMNWPHVVVDRTPGSPFEGDLYVIGTKDTLQGNALWTALVVVRSGDGGRTFDAPRLFEAFRGISFSSVVRIVGIATDRYGFLYIAIDAYWPIDRRRLVVAVPPGFHRLPVRDRAVRRSRLRDSLCGCDDHNAGRQPSGAPRRALQ